MPDLGVLGRITLIVVAASAVGLLFVITVLAMRLMLSLLQGTPVI